MRPATLAEPQQQPSAPPGLNWVRRFDQRNDVPQHVTLLPNRSIGRVIGVPGQIGKLRCDKDRLMPIVEIVLLDLQQTVAPLRSATGLNRQYIDRLVTSPSF